MCKRPSKLADGTMVPCRRCQQCNDRVVNDIVGRCIAESKTATKTLALTLTYGRNSANDADHERAQVLTYSDLQKFIKRLRFHGYDVRYLAIGEYGSKKGRAHWHPILFFKGKVPELPLRENTMWDFWPDGFTFADVVSYAAVRYSVKYVLKDEKDPRKQGKRGMSKKPPLGSEYFKQLAARYVEQGLAPQTLEYTFPEVIWDSPEGPKRVKFFLRGKSAEIFLQAYIDEFARRKPGKQRPRSELVDLFEEWGRVVRDEDAVWQNRVDHISTRKLLQDYPKPRSLWLWKPLAEMREWWAKYWERWPDGEERQRQRERDEWEYYRQWLSTVEHCVEAGAELKPDWAEFVGELLAIYKADYDANRGAGYGDGAEDLVLGEQLDQRPYHIRARFKSGREDLPPEWQSIWDAFETEVTNPGDGEA